MKQEDELDAFNERFPNLSAELSSRFYDSGRPDEETAREMLCDGKSPYLEYRIAVIESVVEDCHAALESIGEFWDALGRLGGHDFQGPEEAREWLQRMIAIWEPWLREQARREEY